MSGTIDMASLANRPHAQRELRMSERRILWRILWKGGRSGVKAVAGRRTIRRWRGTQRMGALAWA